MEIHDALMARLLAGNLSGSGSESGSGSGSGSESGSGCNCEPLVVGLTEELTNDGFVYTLDKTWKEIRDAFPNVYVRKYEDNEYVTMERLIPITYMYYSVDKEAPEYNEWSLSFYYNGESLTLSASDPEEGYPACTVSAGSS